MFAISKRTYLYKPAPSKPVHPKPPPRAVRPPKPLPTFKGNSIQILAQPCTPPRAVRPPKLLPTFKGKPSLRPPPKPTPKPKPTQVIPKPKPKAGREEVFHRCCTLIIVKEFEITRLQAQIDSLEDEIADLKTQRAGMEC